MPETKPLEEFTARELREKLVDFGIPEESAELFKTKAQIIAVIKAKSKDKVETLKEVESPKEKKEIVKKYTAKVDIMRVKLQGQKQLRVKLALEGKEVPGVVKRICELSPLELKNRNLQTTEKNKFDTVAISGTVDTVILNGYVTHVPKGVYIDVPAQVAGALDDADSNTAAAGKSLLYDRFDSKSGKTIREAMT